MKMIIGLVGEKLAGKDEVAKYLKAKYQAFHIKFSQLLDEILQILDMPTSRRNEIDLGLGLRNIFGPEVLYRALKKRALEAGSPIIVINGIRMDEQEKIVKDLGAKIIYVTAPADIRFDRYQKRHEKIDDAVMDFEQFVKQEMELTEVGIPELGKKADFKIENIGTLKELHIKIEEILGKIKKQDL